MATFAHAIVVHVQRRQEAAATAGERSLNAHALRARGAVSTHLDATSRMRTLKKYLADAQRLRRERAEVQQRVARVLAQNSLPTVQLVSSLRGVRVRIERLDKTRQQRRVEREARSRADRQARACGEAVVARGDEAEQEQAAKDLGAAMKQLTNEAQDIAVQVQERADIEARLDGLYDTEFEWALPGEAGRAFSNEALVRRVASLQREIRELDATLLEAHHDTAALVARDVAVDRGRVEMGLLDEAEFERKRKHLNLALRELAWHEMDARYLALKMDDAPDGTPKAQALEDADTDAPVPAHRSAPLPLLLLLLALVHGVLLPALFLVALVELRPEAWRPTNAYCCMCTAPRAPPRPNYTQWPFPPNGDRPPLLRVYCRAERAVKLGQGLHVAPLAASSTKERLWFTFCGAAAESDLPCTSAAVSGPPRTPSMVLTEERLPREVALSGMTCRDGRMMGLTGVYGAVDTRARSGVSAVGAASAGGNILFEVCGDASDLVIFSWASAGSSNFVAYNDPPSYVGGKWRSSAWQAGNPSFRQRVAVNGEVRAITSEALALKQGELPCKGREYYMKMSSDNVFSAVAAWHLYRDAPSKKWLLDNDNVPANGYWAYTSYTAVGDVAGAGTDAGSWTESSEPDGGELLSNSSSGAPLRSWTEWCGGNWRPSALLFRPACRHRYPSGGASGGGGGALQAAWFLVQEFGAVMPRAAVRASNASNASNASSHTSMNPAEQPENLATLVMWRVSCFAGAFPGPPNASNGSQRASGTAAPSPPLAWMPSAACTTGESSSPRPVVLRLRCNVANATTTLSLGTVVTARNLSWSFGVRGPLGADGAVARASAPEGLVIRADTSLPCHTWLRTQGAELLPWPPRPSPPLPGVPSGAVSLLDALTPLRLYVASTICAVVVGTGLGMFVYHALRMNGAPMSKERFPFRPLQALPGGEADGAWLQDLGRRRLGNQAVAARADVFFFAALLLLAMVALAWLTKILASANAVCANTAGMSAADLDDNVSIALSGRMMNLCIVCWICWLTAIGVVLLALLIRPRPPTRGSHIHPERAQKYEISAE